VGVVMKSTLLGALMLLVSGAASAQDFMISPDGNYVARHVLETEPDFERGILPTHRLEIISVECLARELRLDKCVVLSPSNFARKGNRPRWSIDSTAFVSGSRQTLYGLDGSVRPLVGHPWAVEPRVIDLEGPDGNGPPPAPQTPNDQYLIVNGHGLPVGYQSWEPENLVIRSVTGHSLEVSRLAVEAGDVGSTRRWIYPSVRGEVFWYWSPTLGERGRLVEFAISGLEDVPLPASGKGPLKLVADEATNEPVAVLDAFGIHPLPGSEDALAWLTRKLDEVRAAGQPMVRSVAVAVAAKVAFVRMQPGLSPCFEDWLITSDTSVRISEGCAATPNDVAYAVSYVEIPGPVDLPARLYKSSASLGEKRSLIVYMHGGPTANSLDAAMLDNFYADARFDILAVDFRGSTGLGFSHMRALRPPVGDISAEDLRLAVNWVRAQPEYRDGLVGVWGSSWGGLSVHAIASRDSSGIDFLISNSGFIEQSPENIDDLCDAGGWISHVYGAHIDAKGDCLAAYSGVLGREVNTKAAFLSLSGAREQLGTPFKTQMTWATRARKDGACVSTLYSESGGHAGMMWPADSRKRVQEIIRAWIDDVSDRDRTACGLDVRLP